MTSYTQVAAMLRRDVLAGRWPADDPIPGVDRLAQEYGVARGTAHRAVQHLVAAGLLYSQGRRGTFIRPRGEEPMIIRDRNVYRDERGYYFDSQAKDWQTVGTPSRSVEHPPPYIARHLGLSERDYVQIRDRALAPPGAAQAQQMATSYMPMALVGELPVLGADSTGPGGIYDRIEEHFQQQLAWSEMVSARPATDGEQRTLRIGAGLPVLVVTRFSWLGEAETGRLVEINATRMSADMFALSYTVARDESAAWPREERE